MHNLFSKNRDFSDDIFRNIISFRKSHDVFDDINDLETDLSDIANLVEEMSKKNLPIGISREFEYSTAINYPFETEPYMASRYGDGRFGVWYGSLDMETTLYETAYHMIKRETAIEGLNEKIIRERALYKIYCNALLIDLSGERFNYSKLISDTYEFTQQIGRRLQGEGHPGLLAPSARCNGTNVVIFNPKVLSNPRNPCYFTYMFDPLKGGVTIERNPGKTLLKISKRAFTTWKNVETSVF